MKVLLIHGLARTSLSLMGLEQRLLKAGFQPEHFGYFAFAESFDQIAERLRLRLQSLAAQGSYAVVVHSLGGVLLRAALQPSSDGCSTPPKGDWPHKFPNIGELQPGSPQYWGARGAKTALAGESKHSPEHVVMLGTPNQPPRLALHAWRVLPFRWFTGQCGFNLTCVEFYKALPKLPCPYTLIAGTAGPRGPWSPFGDEINDGIVALSETQLGASDRPLQLPVWHTFMMNDPAVQAAVIQALTRQLATPDHPEVATPTETA